ncbi:hypothetical protein EYZ11_000082 [Aspergillus tanneri]|uniref:Uncharacterized protein n=1 Tax=Aspergillus tanneri TaxID=1220188 RepID=A0A4S3JYF3_9EURO|nr:hypothetical protein EYZ11_000082 [Aspergillus tanneri]
MHYHITKLLRTGYGTRTVRIGAADFWDRSDVTIATPMDLPDRIGKGSLLKNTKPWYELGEQKFWTID